jgi:hypothetical protein
MVVGDKAEKPDWKQSTIRSLEIAIELAKTPSFQTRHFGEYASGFAAYETWAETLLDESRRADLDDCCNNYCYVSLVDAREAAAAYLKTVPAELGRPTAAHLGRATDLYEELVAELKSVRSAVPLPAWLLGGNTPQAWSEEMRNTQARALRQSLQLERLAIAELEKALAMARRPRNGSLAGSRQAQSLFKTAFRRYSLLEGKSFLVLQGM